MPVKSVGFAIGNLRARENTLLKSSDMSQLLAAKSVKELAAFMRDKGIGYQNGSTDIPGLLHDDTEKLWKYLNETAPDMSAFEPFIYENDFHNYKAVLKAVIRSRSYEGLLITPASVDIDSIVKAVKDKRFDLLPEFMQKCAKNSYDVLIQSGDSQLCDAIIDAGCMTAQLDKAKQLKNSVILRIITLTVFYNNMKAALRAARAGKSTAFLEETLTETGVVSKKSMVTAALSGEEKLLELLSSATSVGGAEAAECYKKSAGEFEKYSDDMVMKAAKKCKFITMGIEPVIGYMLARKAEIKNLRIIYSGVKTGQSGDSTKERLRELYG